MSLNKGNLVLISTVINIKMTQVCRQNLISQYVDFFKIHLFTLQYILFLYRQLDLCVLEVLWCTALVQYVLMKMKTW